MRIYKKDLDPLSIGDFLSEPDADGVGFRRHGIDIDMSNGQDLRRKAVVSVCPCVRRRSSLTVVGGLEGVVGVAFGAPSHQGALSSFLWH